MADMRRCIGSTTFGIETHEAPVADFPAQASQKDGLGRMCKPHWRQYTGALRKAALERKAADGQVAPRAKRAAAAKPARSGRKAAAPAPESPKVRKAKAVIAATEALAGKAYTDAIGSDAVQAALAESHRGAADTTPVADA